VFRELDFPIIESDGNLIVSKKGTQRFLYKLSVPDLEWSVSAESIIDYAGGLLRQLNPKDSFKVYRISGEVFVDSSTELESFLGLDCTPLLDPIRSFLGDASPYADIEFFHSHVDLGGDLMSFVALEGLLSGELTPCALDDLDTDFMIFFAAKGLLFSKKILEHRRRMTGAHNSEHRDHLSELGYSSVDEELRKLHTSESILLNCKVWMIARATSKATLKEEVRYLIQELKLRSRPFLETHQLPKVFSYPVAMFSLGYYHLVKTKYLLKKNPLGFFQGRDENYFLILRPKS